jgi:hypothetical protein
MLWSDFDLYLVLITIKVATWVAETCRWLLRNKMTFINPSELLSSLYTFYTSISMFVIILPTSSFTSNSVYYKSLLIFYSLKSEAKKVQVPLKPY